jgi:hypothetical protein
LIVGFEPGIWPKVLLAAKTYGSAFYDKLSPLEVAVAAKKIDGFLDEGLRLEAWTSQSPCVRSRQESQRYTGFRKSLALYLD